MQYNKCSKSGCLNPQEAGDKIFCPAHRVDWKNLVLKLGIAENPYVPETEVYTLLRRFCAESSGGLSKWT